MAEIIGWDLEVRKKFTCKNCGAIVQYLEADIKKYSGRDYSGGSDGRHWVKCPGCGEEHTLKSW